MIYSRFFQTDEIPAGTAPTYALHEGGCRTWIVGTDGQVQWTRWRSYVTFPWFHEPVFSDDPDWLETKAKELIQTAAGPLMMAESVEDALLHVRRVSWTTDPDYHFCIMEGNTLYVVGRGVGRRCVQGEWTAMGLIEPQEVFGFAIHRERPSRFEREDVL